MTYVFHKEGNIFSTTARAVGHGVNIRGAMGAGIADQFRKMFPAMYEEYRERCLRGDLLPGGLHAWSIPNSETFIYNIASQDEPGANANYEWLARGVRKALTHAESQDINMIALPRIGSGIGGLDEGKVEGILIGLAASSPVDIELWTYKP